MKSPPFPPVQDTYSLKKLFHPKISFQLARPVVMRLISMVTGSLRAIVKTYK